MQDRYVIMGTGFKNVVKDGHATGYQLDVRIPYYRGVYLSAVHFLELAMDGKPVPDAKLRIVVSGQAFTIPEMYEADNVRWDFGAPATLLVEAPGGLDPGLHTVRVGIVIRKSYLPAEDPEHLYDEAFSGVWRDGKYSTFIEKPTVISRAMTLVQ